MKRTPGSLEDYIARIDSGEPFTLTRYGDGEFQSILGERGKNCDGVQYTPGLQEALTETLLKPKGYIYGMLDVALHHYRAEIRAFHKKHSLNIEWANADFMVAASKRGELNPLLRSLQSCRILYVGPKHLRGLCQFLPITEFVQTHKTKAFAYWELTAAEVRKRASKVDLIGVSCGPAAKVLIYDLYSKLGSSHTILDFGSLWDGYVGVRSRRYMQESSWTNVMEKNLNHELV